MVWQVYEQRPLAFLQIILAIFAIEVWGNKQQEKTAAGGDLGFDPLGLRCVLAFICLNAKIRSCPCS